MKLSRAMFITFKWRLASDCVTDGRGIRRQAVANGLDSEISKVACDIGLLAYAPSVYSMWTLMPMELTKPIAESAVVGLLAMAYYSSRISQNSSGSRPALSVAGSE
jgi:hypothetical protein